MKTIRKARAARARPAKKSPPKKKAAATSARKVGPRADYGAPIDGFFARQSPPLRPVLQALRAMVEEAAPDARAALKWGMPVYTIDGTMMCALTGHKSHVNLVLAGPPAAFADPEGRLAGAGKTGRHLKLRSIDELPRPAVRAWLRTAAAIARKKA